LLLAVRLNSMHCKYCIKY